MPYHDDLLAQAGHLANLDRTRPKQVNLRRAVSAAYYAMFHLLIASAVNNWRIERQRADLSRAFEHRKMKGVCNNLVSTSAELALVAETFVVLQQNRHRADYDNARVWTRVEVRDHIRSVKDAFAAWSRVRNQPQAQDFLLTLFVPERR